MTAKKQNKIDQDGSVQEKDQKRKLHLLRISLSTFLFLVTVIAIILFCQTKIIPGNLSIPFALGWLFLTTAFILLHKRFRIISTVLLLVQLLFNLVTIIFSLKYNSYFSALNENPTYEEKYSLVTLSDSALGNNQIKDISPTGILSTDPYLEDVEKYLTNHQILSQKISQEQLIKFENLLALTNSLSTSTQSPPVNSIFLNHTYLDTIKENNPDFFSKLKVLQDFSISVTPRTIETAKNVSLDHPFVVYLSGIDNRDHTLPYAARSDVNLLVVVNPHSKQILILNTPRDFYVPLAMNGKNDKLTHAGLYGVNESLRTLENFYQIKINYYARINFDAFSSIIDQIGGVDVSIPYTVNTYHGGRHYAPGNYHLNGDEALDFARERVSLSWAGGDRERGRNQEKILIAIFQKLQSDINILNRIDGIFTSVTKNMQTNLTGDDLKYLVQKQLSNLTFWRIRAIDVDGKADITSTYTYPEPKHFVWHPDPDSVNEAKIQLKAYLEE